MVAHVLLSVQKKKKKLQLDIHEMLRIILHFIVSTFRRQASVLAVNNARQKATEIAKYLHGAAGKAVSIQEVS